MNAISENGKEYVHILELHKNITDENVRDSIPEVRIATLANSEHINWVWILERGLMPIVKPSPSILRSTIKDYYFTPEFWFCDCEFDWLRVKHFACPECGATVIKHLTENRGIANASKLWGEGPFESLELTALKGIKRAFERKMHNAVITTLYQHLKAFDFKWTNAFAIQNF